MKIIVGVLLFLVAGCSSPQGMDDSETRLAGTYCHSSIDAAACITLKADHSYREHFYSGAVGIPSESRGEGDWRHRNHEIWLYPDHGSRRVLTIIGGKEELELSEKHRLGMVTIYRRNRSEVSK
jgi:hypothetical protein